MSATPWLLSWSKLEEWPPQGPQTFWTSSPRASISGYPWCWVPLMMCKSTSPSFRNIINEDQQTEPTLGHTKYKIKNTKILFILAFWTFGVQMCTPKTKGYYAMYINEVLLEMLCIFRPKFSLFCVHLYSILNILKCCLYRTYLEQMIAVQSVLLVVL